MEHEDDVGQLIQDLQYIKEAVKRNHAVLREIVAPPRFQWLLLYIGTSIVLVSLLFQYCIGQFGSFQAVPQVAKLLLYVVIAVVAASTVFFKFMVLNRGAKQIDRRLTVWKVYRENLVPIILHIYLPLLVVTLAVAVYCAHSGHGADIVGVVAIGVGFFLNVGAVVAGVPEYEILGYWLLVSGTLSLFVPGISGGVWSAICYGGGSYAIVIALQIQRLRSWARSSRG
ncbi:MAG TPA: hypothetical protein VMV68_10620 [Spirochaetia bacterium]|nr:hypothetical protein [Spirochaetia bacterium]